MTALQEQHARQAAYDDEISLVDLWLVLARRKLVIVTVTALCAALGLGVALLKQKEYAYRTTLEIGSVIAGNSTRPIDNPQNVLSKVQESYIPLVLSNYAKAHEGDDSVYTIKASVPKNSEIVILEAQGSEELGKVYLELLGMTVTQLRADHQRIVASLKKEIEIKKNSVENDLAALQDTHRILIADQKRLEEVATLLKSQIADTERLLNTAEKHRTAAIGEARNEAKAMTLLMLDNETRETRKLLSQLQERLHLEVSRKQDDVVKALADNERKQAETRDLLSKLELDLTNFRETRAVVEPMRSLKPVGTGRGLIVVLSLFLGLIGGVFAAFFAEFYSKVRAAARQEGEGSP